MNKIKKNNKQWLNNIIGAIVSLILIWYIYKTIFNQFSNFDKNTWQLTGNNLYLYLCIFFMCLNFLFESLKWYVLVNNIEKIEFKQIIYSYFFGMACAVFTPNRIGEYPGRILYLGKKHTFRYLNISIMGIIAQLISVFSVGFFGLLYYNYAFPSSYAQAALIFCISLCIVFFTIYFNFQTWLNRFSSIKYINKFAVYFRILNKFSYKSNFLILLLSILRYLVYSFQYLFLLFWFNVNANIYEGLCLCILFFWILTVVPSFALAEFGIRGSIGLFLFKNCSGNTIGILSATIGLWLINIAVPAIIGSFLLLHLRFFKIHADETSI